MSDLDDLLGTEVEVEPSLGSRPLLVQVLVALAIGGVLIAMLISFILSGLSSIAADPQPPAKNCGGIASCAWPNIGTGVIE